MTLGELTDTLAALPLALRVRFDFGADPTSLVSWRGDYSHLSLDSGADDHRTTVAMLLRDARRADGATFEGYKGGDYTMHRGVPVWADPWGECHKRAIMGVVVERGEITLLTLLVGGR